MYGTTGSTSTKVQVLVQVPEPGTYDMVSRFHMSTGHVQYKYPSSMHTTLEDVSLSDGRDKVSLFRRQPFSANLSRNLTLMES